MASTHKDKDSKLSWLLPLCFLSAAGLSAGCDSKSTPPSGTGAEEVVGRYYQALLRHDWTAAYAAVHPTSRALCAEQQFAELAGRYRQHMGFDPVEVHVRSCEEHGSEAVAHIVFSGPDAGQLRYYKDAVIVRQSREGWRVILPPRFRKAHLRPGTT